ncbi:terpenoid synthase [Paxillus ammoniavirescens]|nr:terpenoid synthase [Paxillus ammoniavirescens]
MFRGLRQPSRIAHLDSRANRSSWTRTRKPPLRIAMIFNARASSGLNALNPDKIKLPQVLPPLQRPPLGVSNTSLQLSLIQCIRTTIRRLLTGCDVQYKVVPFDHAFYQECVDVSAQRGYPAPSFEPFEPYLRIGALFGVTAAAHGTSRHVATRAHDSRGALRIWTALYTACVVFADDIPSRFPWELPNLRAFNDRFVRGEKQGNTVLDALADLLRDAPRVFGGPVPANLVTTSTLDFITATMIEVETNDMQISAMATQYPYDQRIMSGVGKAYVFMVFPADIPFEEYIQAMPDIAFFICAVNDLLSFYKEELVEESTNFIAMIAARKGISRVEAFEELAGNTVELYRRIVSILEDSPQPGLGSMTGMAFRDNEGTLRAREAFKQFAAGFILFHLSSERYRLMEVGL